MIIQLSMVREKAKTSWVIWCNVMSTFIVLNLHNMTLSKSTEPQKEKDKTRIQRCSMQ